MEKPNIKSVPMSVSRSPAPSSIDLSGVPARVAEAVAQVVAVCHEQFRSDPCPEAFEEAELRVRETMNALACELLGAVIEKRDDGASRIERDGQSWFRVFTKIRERLLAGDVASRFLTRLLAQPAVKRLLSREHFSVDGTLIEAWASIKSFRAIDEEPPGDDDGGADGTDGGGRNRERDFHGARWSNATHRSVTDGDCRLYRKGRGKEAKLSYLGHALMENRHGLVVDGLASRATGSAECLAGEVMLMRREDGERAVTVGADKAYDTADFVDTCAAFRVEPHVARNTSGRRSNIADAVAQSAPYRAS